jgi:ankyrin repeat protein
MSVVRSPGHVSPSDSLILHVKDCRDSLALLFGLMNPLVGAAIACSSSSESASDLAKLEQDMQNGADVNYRDRSSWTDLMHAAYYGYPAIVQFLLEKGAQKDMTVLEAGLRDWRGYTAGAIAHYYLRDYRELAKDCRPDMRTHYETCISRYQQVADLLR